MEIEYLVELEIDGESIIPRVLIGGDRVYRSINKVLEVITMCNDKLPNKIDDIRVSVRHVSPWQTINL